MPRVCKPCSVVLGRLLAVVELPLLRRRLEPTVAELGRRVDELEVDLLQRLPRGLREERLPHRDQVLLHADHRTLDHEPVLRHVPVVREATERRDRLLRQVVLRHGVVRVLLQVLADLVHLLVDLRTVVATELTRPRRLELHTLRVPRADARNLPQTTVSLPRETRRAPARDHALEPATL